MGQGRMRLDQLLVERGLAPSRQQAQRWIRAGWVRSGAQILDKPGQSSRCDLALQVQQQARFVSRGGEKLLGAVHAFALQVSGRTALDAGISTGGFTDCLLQQGCRRIYGVDVGYGQVAWRLRQDRRLVLKERCNLRHLTPATLYGPDEDWADLAVADLSFISLGLVLPALKTLLKPPQEAAVLIKPQFEVGRALVGRGGVVRDARAQVSAIKAVQAKADCLDWCAVGLAAAPIKGAAGNQEYWLHLIRSDKSEGRHTVEPEQVEATVQAALGQDTTRA
ncbi:TlyA family rRNA (cytidine-2'-O)-methyltransferase [Candidatus Synechococcus spongiarum LMB bulk15M]|uniref:TlyA family rRNA (Cytidine-2'-O)-methyltransferase n=1 Tax=Candidatus Synechococcus spongiarum LMB bulk15M TaxID=1943582 RepID=A0A1T1CNG5_9SYNE|nr:TlyA family rRNA (cytidine-2'-O)-methyltransferase [Candidatus Synechococcus spongiarum LMB bulk15M]